MFFDPQAPIPGGFDPPPPPTPKLSATQERVLLRIIGVLLLAMFLGPLAGSSIVSGLIALARSIP